MANKNFPELAAEAYRNPFGIIDKYASEGKKLFGYTCSYVPEEIIYAAGIIPVRMIGRAQSIRKVDRYLQTYCCSQIRCLMEDCLNGDYDKLSGVIFAHTCDSMQSFFDIFKKNFPKLLVRNVNLPSVISGDAAFKYAAIEIERFKKMIEEFTGSAITPEALSAAVAVYNRNRELLDRLYSLHLSYPDAIPSVTLLHAICASIYMDKKEVNDSLSAYLDGFVQKPEDTKRKRIMLIGSININEEPYQLADEFGAMIADDDMCTGRRYFADNVATPSIEGITKRYLERPHCAAKHRNVRSRENYLLDLIKKQKIDGVIFLYLKFCDPHGFDYPDLRKAMDKANVPNQYYEIEQSLSQSGQMRTKMQAFMEILS